MTQSSRRNFTAEEVQLMLAGLNCTVLGHHGRSYVYDPGTDTICSDGSGAHYETLVDDWRCPGCKSHAEQLRAQDELG